VPETAVKDEKIQRLAPRQPRQERARHKVALILEAAMRLLGKGGAAALTTNAVAETAGVSIGTLYQYFANKEAIPPIPPTASTIGKASSSKPRRRSGEGFRKPHEGIVVADFGGR
jgi:DNA-binding transcriptional regulator YbjK